MTSIHQLPATWLPVSIAPVDSDLEICVIDRTGIHALIFPCRKAGAVWVDASTGHQVNVLPTHWRKWGEGRSAES